MVDTDAPKYIRYCLGTCWRKLLELGLFEFAGGPLIFADAPAMAIAEVLDYPVCLDSVDEGMRVCWKPIVPICYWPDCLIMSYWCA